MNFIILILFGLFKFTLSKYYLNSYFNEWTWLTSHNSHLNWHDNSVIYLASNQNLSIDQQLKYGVRGFMLDIDYKKCNDLERLFGSCKCEGIFI